MLYCGFGVVMLHGLYVSRDGNKLLSNSGAERSEEEALL